MFANKEVENKLKKIRIFNELLLAFGRNKIIFKEPKYVLIQDVPEHSSRSRSTGEKGQRTWIFLTYLPILLSG